MEMRYGQMDQKTRTKHQNNLQYKVVKRLNKISSKQMNKIKENMKFYDFDELSSDDDKKIVVKFNDSVDKVTYSDLTFFNGREMYEYKKKILIEFIRKILDTVSENNCIIIKYNEKWIVNKKESLELASILNNRLITNKLKGGILVAKNDRIVELFIESVFKYNSFIQIVCQDSKLIISPSDHMDIFFQSNNFTELSNLIIDSLNANDEDVLIYELI